MTNVTAAAVTDSSGSPLFVLDDTTTQGTGTEDDWAIRLDWISDEDFSVRWNDDDGSSGGNNFTHPFVITNGEGYGIRSHSLVVRGTSVTGNSLVGINQPLPATPLHITHSSPTVRFDDNAGFLQIWDLIGNSISFFVLDRTAGTAPLWIDPGAPSNTLRLNDNGFVGLGTSSPGEELEISRAFPTVRFNDNGGTLQVWDIEGNSINFQVQDVTNGGLAPFVIQPGTPHQTLHLNSTGRIGIGTNTPAARLHVIGGGIIEEDLHVAGTLTKGAGSFKIDHPLEPAKRFLSHSFVESPDMKNVYDGVVTLDEKGAAWVELPEWFGALNRDFRYQLTALDYAAPGLHVAERIADNRFRIAGGEPGMEVSWLVTGIRQDAYAEKNPIVVEEDKRELRGRYLHPEAHDQPAELAIGRVEPPEAEVAATSTGAPKVSNPQEATSQMESESTEGDRR